MITTLRGIVKSMYLQPLIYEIRGILDCQFCNGMTSRDSLAKIYDPLSGNPILGSYLYYIEEFVKEKPIRMYQAAICG